MGYHQKKQSICYWVPRKRRQGGRDRKVKENIAENFSKLGRDLDIQVYESGFPNIFNPKDLI